MEMEGNLNTKYIVYCTTNLINNKIYIGVHKTQNPDVFDGYIGCGVNVYSNSTYSHPKTKFQYAVKKYGPKNFRRTILKIFDNEEDAFMLESELIDEEYLKRTDVYNMVLGGHGGDIAKMATPCFAYTIDGFLKYEFKSIQEGANFMSRGRTTIARAIIEKTKAANLYWSLKKVDKLDLNEFITSTNKIAIYQYSELGKYETCFESIQEAARQNNVPASNLQRAIQLGYKIGNKYFSEIYSNEFSIAKTNSLKRKKIYQYSLEGIFIKEFENVNQARKELNIKTDIGSAIRRGQTCGGYQWSYEKLNSMPDISDTPIIGVARKVGVYSLSGELIETFRTVTECQKKYSSCKHVLHGKRKTGNGHIFKYLD